MSWIYLMGASVILWALCGAVIAAGRRLWSMQTTLYVHLVAAPAFAFVLSTLHRHAFAEFDSLTRAGVMTGIAMALDALIVAPLFERGYAMFRSVLGTWLPFAAIFLASLVA
ncbi:MAG: hypothetical protein KGJ78_15890 [Alphaproteobacteria bacterium]|nr:hypothetical protein [Alphaproteobacteria bacterium]